MSFFVEPIVGAGTRQDPFEPKYLPSTGSWASCALGGSAIVYWQNVTQAELSTLQADSSCLVVPPLDNTIGAGALNTVKSELEALDIPAQWVQVGMTYRTVLRVVVGMSQLTQRMSGILGVNVTIPGNLNRTISQLPANYQTALYQACSELGIDSSEILSSTTLREALRNFGQQFVAGKTIALGDL